MRYFVIFLLILSGIGFYFNYQKNLKMPIIGSKKALAVANGKYSYEPMTQNAFKYIIKMHDGQYYQERKNYPKALIYTNIVDTTCPYRQKFQKIIQAFAQNEDWQKGYRFINYDINESQSFMFTSKEEFEEFQAFMNACGNFCIVNFEKNAIFIGKESNKEYIIDVISAFY